jgi:hypothetical protein
MVTSTHVATLYHKLSLTLAHSHSNPDFNLFKQILAQGLSGDFVLRRQLKLCPETSQTNAPKTIFQGFHRHSLLWSWLNLRDYSGDYCTAKEQSHWDDFFAQIFLELITNLLFKMRRLLARFCANIPIYLPTVYHTLFCTQLKTSPFLPQGRRWNSSFILAQEHDLPVNLALLLLAPN